MYYSEHGQDKWLNENIFHDKRDGVFIEFGALDGVLDSNTLFYEKELGWNGLLIEANPEQFMKMVNNDRLAQKLCCAVSRTFGVTEFTSSGAMGWSGITENLGSNRIDKIRNTDVRNGFIGKYFVPTLSLNTIINDCLPNKTIDYISIDVEGSEYDILSTFNFSCDINIFDIENEYGDDRIAKEMARGGYDKINRIGINDIYRRK